MTKEAKATGIKNWPEDDRPREKLLKKGAGVELGSTSQAIYRRIARVAARVRCEFSARNIKSLLE